VAEDAQGIRSVDLAVAIGVATGDAGGIAGDGDDVP
jgi:hypothetical protein